MNENEDIESIDRMMMGAALERQTMANNAVRTCERKQRLTPEEKLARWQQLLNPKICAPFSQLIATGVDCYWKYEAMSDTAFEAAVSDHLDRLAIGLVMSRLGFVRGVPFTEEMLRTLRGQAQSI